MLNKDFIKDSIDDQKVVDNITDKVNPKDDGLSSLYLSRKSNVMIDSSSPEDTSSDNSSIDDHTTENLGDNVKNNALNRGLVLDDLNLVEDETMYDVDCGQSDGSTNEDNTTNSVDDSEHRNVKTL